MSRSRSRGAATIVVGPPLDLCLAYANTLAWRGSDAPVEQLDGVGAFFAWLAGPGGLDAPAVAPLADQAGRRPNAASAVFADALVLREAIYRVLCARATGTPAADADVARLERAIAAAPARARLVRRDGVYGWRLGRLPLSVPALLAPVLWSASDLLVGGDAGRLRLCANEKCLWLFVDASRTGTRRWCDMASCGNRAKARRHYLKGRHG